MTPSTFGGFLRSRCSMQMWYPDDIVSLLLAWPCSASARALPVQRCILAQARFGALGGMMRCRSFTDVLWATSPA